MNPMIRPLHIDEIGGAVVRQGTITAGHQVFRVGQEIPLDELRGWKPTNRNNLITSGRISVWPKSVTFLRQNAAPSPEPEDDDDAKQRIVMPRGFGKYCVIEGRLIADGITKDEADQIAGVPRAASSAGKPVFRKHNPRSRAYATAPEPKMPMGIKPADDDEPNGPVES